jgi:hypothetical protein
MYNVNVLCVCSCVTQFTHVNQQTNLKSYNKLTVCCLQVKNYKYDDGVKLEFIFEKI